MDLPAESEAVAASARRKVARRVLPLLLLIYVVAYLDRATSRSPSCGCRTT